MFLKVAMIALALSQIETVNGQTIKPQVVDAPRAQAPAAPAAAPAPVVAPPSIQGGFVAVPAAASNSNNNNGAAAAGALVSMLNSLFPSNANSPNPHGDNVPEGTDYGTWNYPDSYKFYSGSVGAGNIGNGLCTEANKNRSQIQRGYCQQLKKILDDPNSCANRAIKRILAEAGPSGSGIGDLHLYCSKYDGLGEESQKSDVFLQVLATLITQESGWNAGAKEPEWYKNGHPMGGKGLFQIGVNDRNFDQDCFGLNESTIYDPKVNMKCGSCIALSYLAYDRTMGHGTGDSGARGMARYFGPLRDMQARKRLAMAGAVNNYCEANANGTAGARGLATVAPADSTR